MSDLPNMTETEDTPMRHREITLADGRYMIFYTFDNEDMATDDPREDV